MRLYPIFLLPFLFNSCHSQSERFANGFVGGPCEGCEAVYEYGDRSLTNVDTLPGFMINKPQLKLTGTVFQKDGKTPAENVILYIYHTNREGIYKSEEDAKRWERRHGSTSGWIKKEGDGKYTFYTFRPASYPERSEPEHIHMTIIRTRLK